jgi:hypothetical protein
MVHRPVRAHRCRLTQRWRHEDDSSLGSLLPLTLLGARLLGNEAIT